MTTSNSLNPNATPFELTTTTTTTTTTFGYPNSFKYEVPCIMSEESTSTTTDGCTTTAKIYDHSTQWVKIPKTKSFFVGQKRIFWRFKKYKSTFFAIIEMRQINPFFAQKKKFKTFFKICIFWTGFLNQKSYFFFTFQVIVSYGNEYWRN